MKFHYRNSSNDEVPKMIYYISDLDLTWIYPNRTQRRQQLVVLPSQGTPAALVALLYIDPT